MSWLFDRLCGLAASDRVDIMVDVALPCATDDRSVRLADLLVRAARARELTLSVVHAGPTSANPQEDVVIDLDTFDDGECAEQAVAALLSPTSSTSWSIHAHRGTVTRSESMVRTIEQFVGTRLAGRATVQCVASDRPDSAETLGHLDWVDLDIIVDAEGRPGLNVVESAGDLLLVLDALVILRHVAFGTEDQPCPDGAELLQRPRLRRLLAT